MSLEELIFSKISDDQNNRFVFSHGTFENTNLEKYKVSILMCKKGMFKKVIKYKLMISYRTNLTAIYNGDNIIQSDYYEYKYSTINECLLQIKNYLNNDIFMTYKDGVLISTKVYNSEKLKIDFERKAFGI